MITVNNKSPGAYTFATPLGLNVSANLFKFCITNNTNKTNKTNKTIKTNKTLYEKSGRVFLYKTAFLGR